MPEWGARILKSFHRIPKDPSETKKVDPEGPEVIFDLRKFVETFVTSLPNIIKAFPGSNLDMDALEAHLWDRIRYFFKFEKFDDVKIDKKEEIIFINKAIAAIEDWFYSGNWTSCLAIPGTEDINRMFSTKENTFLKRVQKEKDTENNPNLGRDREIPNIYEELASGKNPKDVYKRHAFKFFHGPAGVINVLTKVSAEKDIVSNMKKFDDFIRSVTQFATTKFNEWGYKPGDPNSGRVRVSLNSLSKQPDVYKKCRRTLFFMKTCLEAAEMIRREGHEHLTREDFEKVLTWIQDTQEDQISRASSADYIPFNFSEKGDFQGSLMHVSSRELPLALLAVEYLRSNNAIK